MKENYRFLTFSDNTFHTKGFTWASQIHPRSDIIDRVCERCGAVEKYPSGSFDVTLENGSKFPDILGCGAYPFLILSEKVINGLQEMRVSCFHVFDVGIKEIKSKRLIKKEMDKPHYYRVEIDGVCHIDLAASSLEIVKYCEKCHNLLTKPMVASGFKMIPGSWDGNELFRDAILYPRVNFCTKPIMDLIHDFHLTNFRFEPMEGPWNSASKGINYS